MLSDAKRRRRIGTIILIVCVICAVAFYGIRESNQPVYVSSSWGSGYMTDGWGDALPLFSFMIGLSVCGAIAGALMVIWPDEKTEEDKGDRV